MLVSTLYFSEVGCRCGKSSPDIGVFLVSCGHRNIQKHSAVSPIEQKIRS